MNLIDQINEKVWDWPAPWGVIAMFFLITLLIPFAIIGAALGIVPWVALYFLVRAIWS